MRKVKKNTAASIATLMALSVAPVPANAIGYWDVAPYATDTSTTLQSLHGEVAYLPIEDATTFLNYMADRLHFHLVSIRAEWDTKQKPINVRQSRVTRKYLVTELQQRVLMATEYIEAVKLVLADIQNGNIKKSVTAFGRAAAKLRYGAEEVLSFIEQTHPPKKTTSKQISINAGDVKALITAEHKKLGLSAPLFYQAS